jgi:hypothetical protein
MARRLREWQQGAGAPKTIEAVQRRAYANALSLGRGMNLRWVAKDEHLPQMSAIKLWGLV